MSRPLLSSMPLPALRRVLRQFGVRPRLMSAIVVGLLTTTLLPDRLAAHTGSRFLVGWNVGSLLYLALALRLMLRSSHEQMRRRALVEEDGRVAVLVVVIAASLTVLYAIASQLATVKDLHGLLRTRHVAVAALTVFTSWAFTQTMFALQYAHDFYLARQRDKVDPLVFPGTPDPAYADFLYFSCVLGTSAQTADVSFQGSALRPIGLVHCVLSFFFNTTVLALTINIAAGLF